MIRKLPKYIKWIYTLPCCLCGAEAEPHHIKGIGHFSGGGLKAPDWLAMPLCREHHAIMHADPHQWADQPLMVLRTLFAAVEAGEVEIRAL